MERKSEKFKQACSSIRDFRVDEITGQQPFISIFKLYVKSLVTSIFSAKNRFFLNFDKIAMKYLC